MQAYPQVTLLSPWLTLTVHTIQFLWVDMMQVGGNRVLEVLLPRCAHSLLVYLTLTLTVIRTLTLPGG